MEILPKQAKTQVKAQAINKKMTKLGNQVASTSKIVMNDVVNPLGKASAKVGATVVGGLGKTALDMGLTAANELLRDAACFSLNELKQRDEVQTMKYSLNKLLGKTNKPQAKQSANNFML
jgi:cell shape-determining protein MreC